MLGGALSGDGCASCHTAPLTHHSRVPGRETEKEAPKGPCHGGCGWRVSKGKEWQYRHVQEARPAGHGPQVLAGLWQQRSLEWQQLAEDSVGARRRGPGGRRSFRELGSEGQRGAA